MVVEWSGFPMFDKSQNRAPWWPPKTMPFVWKNTSSCCQYEDVARVVTSKIHEDSLIIDHVFFCLNLTNWETPVPLAHKREGKANQPKWKPWLFYHPILLIYQKIIQYHPISSNIIQYHPISSNIIQYHPISSNISSNHSHQISLSLLFSPSTGHQWITWIAWITVSAPQLRGAAAPDNFAHEAVLTVDGLEHPRVNHLGSNRGDAGTWIMGVGSLGDQKQNLDMCS